MRPIATLAAICCEALSVAALGAPADFQSRFQAIGLARTSPAFTCFSVDSLGQGKTAFNPVLNEGAVTSALQFATQATNRFTYSARLTDGRPAPAWSVECREKTLILRSEFAGDTNPLPPFVLAFNQRSNHATLLGMMRPGDRGMSLPCVLHMPDMGSVRITGSAPGLKLDYDARRYVKTPFVRVAFPPASAAQPQVEYHLEVVAIHPTLPGIETNALFDGFRRDFLNIFQVNPRVQMLANNASSDPVPFTLFVYAEVARRAPPLADGLTCLDLVRMTLDRYLGGTKGYGQVGYGTPSGDADLVAWKAPWTSLDTHPSLHSLTLTPACWPVGRAPMGNSTITGSPSSTGSRSPTGWWTRRMPAPSWTGCCAR